MKTDKILQHFRVPFTERHPSISKACYGVDCPFCGDNNKHLGVFKENGNYSCFKCGAKGSLFKLLQTLKGISYKEYCEISGKTFSNLNKPKDELDKIFNRKKEIIMESKPLDFLGLISTNLGRLPNSIKGQIDRFVIERRLTHRILESYCCFYGASGYFTGRLVIPIFSFKDSKWQKIVGLVGRDLTNTSKSKYKFNEGFKKSEYLYFAKKPVKNEIIVLVEGIFDVWAVYITTGLNSTATFGSNISKKQIRLLNDITNKIIYLADSDVDYSKIMRRKASLEGSSRVICNRCPDKTDPCSMDRSILNNMLSKNVLLMNEFTK